MTREGGVPTGKAHPDNLRSTSVPATSGLAGAHTC